MEQRHANKDPFAVVVRSQQEEIERFKWLESERRGHDIGWAGAVLEWQNKYYQDWKRYALKDRPAQDRAGSLPLKQRRRLSDEHRAKLSASLKTWAARRATGR